MMRNLAHKVQFESLHRAMSATPVRRCFCTLATDEANVHERESRVLMPIYRFDYMSQRKLAQQVLWGLTQLPNLATVREKVCFR